MYSEKFEYDAKVYEAIFCHMYGEKSSINFVIFGQNVLGLIVYNFVKFGLTH